MSFFYPLWVPGGGTPSITPSGAIITLRVYFDSGHVSALLQSPKVLEADLDTARLNVGIDSARAKSSLDSVRIRMNLN